MRFGRTRALVLILAVAVPLVPTRPAEAATGVTLGGVDISLDYFVALDAFDEDSDSRGASDFTMFNDTLSRTLSNAATSARARVSGSAFVDKALDDSLEGLSANASMSGTAAGSSDDDFVSVANPFSSFDASFSPATEVQFFVNTSMSASNTDSDDCSSVEITLSGPVSFYRQAHAGGDCGTFDPASGTTSGAMPPGEYSIEVEADVSMAGEDGTATGSASYGVALYIMPPCDVTGTPDPDTLDGTAADEVFCGLGGNDIINGGGGNDIITGGAGADEITGGQGLDEIFGEGGDDELRGGPGTDLIYGSDGDDRIFGDDGSESSISNPPNAGLIGGTGNDTINGGNGADMLIGDEGNDVLEGSRGNDQLTGAAGSDDLLGGADADKLAGGDARDFLFGDAGPDDLLGGAAGDRLKGGTGNDSLKGELGDDELFGEENADTMIGDLGDDRLTGGGGLDDMNGGANKDFFSARDGLKDKVAGGPGRDRARRDRIDTVSSIEVFL